MNAHEALEAFRRKAKAGRVMNLRTGEAGPISPSMQASIESSYRAAITYAAGRSDLARIPYNAYADRLHEFAVRHAEEHGLADGSNRAARCRRFVATVDGKVRERRRFGEGAVPEGWRDLYRLLRDHELATEKRARKAGFLAALAQSVAVHGVRAPDELPSRNVLKRWLLDEKDVSRQAYDNMLVAYREARRLHMRSDAESTLPDIDRCPIEGERGLRGLPDIVERLEAAGYTGPINEIDIDEVIRLLAPRWYRAVKRYIDAHRDDRAADFTKKVLLASSHFLAALVRTGLGELETAHPTALLFRTVEMGEAVPDERSVGDEWERELAESLGVDLGEGDAGGPKPIKVRLFEALAREMAEESAANSPLTVIKGEIDDGPAYWSQTMIAETRIIGDLALFAGEGTQLFRAVPERAREAELALQDLLRRMKQENRRLSFADRKPKSRLLKLVTLPMVLCLGLPALRRHVLRLRENWHAMLLRHSPESDHRHILRAETEYDRWLTSYVVFAVFIADGLRLANYSGARLGPVEERTPTEAMAPDGTVIRSYCHIHPLLAEDGDGLDGVQTNFFGDDHPHVKLKIDKVAGSESEWRERPHWLRPGIVDMELLWDYLTRVRPKHLARQGLISSVADYSLERDVVEQHFALFVSDTTSEDPYRAITGAYTPATISEIYGRTLHWICTEVLGRELPAFGPELRRRYPRVFSAHSSRLLLGTYLYGVLDRKLDATVLLNDTARIVERRYSVTEASMVHRTGWEHPRFFDRFFERIWDDGEVIDWDREDPLHGIPPSERPRGLRYAA